VLRLEVLEDRSLLNHNYLVSNLADSGAGSLRQAVLDTNARPGHHEIDFELGLQGTIVLTSGALNITSDLTIAGPGPEQIAVDGNAASRVFEIAAGVTAEIDGLTITNGSATLGGGILNDGGTLTVSDSVLAGNSAWRGGGISNFGSLTVSYSTLAGNTADSKGGGIANFGPLALSYSSLTGNSAGTGGAMYDFDGASLTMNYCTLAGNSADFGAGLFIDGGMVALTNSTIAGNFASVGGGILNSFSALLTVSNCTLAGNFAIHQGGGIDNEFGATLTIGNSTFSGNTATDGGGIANFGTMTCRDTILAANTAAHGADLSGNLGSQGHNLIGDIIGGNGFDPSDLLNLDALLGPLQDNGGPTWTIKPLPGSPAVDTGDQKNAPEWDQRGPGFPRIVGDRMDIGAFQVQPGPATHLQISVPTSMTSNEPFDVTVTALDAYGHTAVGYLGTVTFSSADTDPGIVLPADYTFAVGDHGVHTFVGGFTLVTLGDQTVTAVDTNDPTIAVSATVSVVDAAS
jgi:hypothetical protein